MIDPLVSGAFVTGLLGSAHCFGMCGPIPAALGLTGRAGGALVHQALYNLGRIGAYALVGLLVGRIGMGLTYAGGLGGAGRWLLVAGDLFVIAAGLAGAARLGGFDPLGSLGGPLTAVTAAVRALRRLPPGAAALPLGFAMGFIPCGFLFSVVVTAGLTASPWTALAIMVAFGLGTAPALFLFGSVAGAAKASRRAWMVRAAGLGVALMGCWHLWRHLTVPVCCL